MESSSDESSSDDSSAATNPKENETALNSAARKVFAEMRAIKQRNQDGGKGGKKGGDVKSAKSKKKKQQKGVIYLGHIPHGFYEDQMKGFFSQFGEVTRLRLSRSKKTGRSKSYAFIEFDSAEDASIVARTMNGYILTGRVLVCHTIPPEKVHADMFKGANKKFKRLPWRLIAKQRQNAERTDEQKKKKKRKLLAKEEKKRQKLKALGIDYEFAGYSNKTTNDLEESSDNGNEKPKTKAKRGKKTTTKAKEPKKKAATRKSTRKVTLPVEEEKPKKKASRAKSSAKKTPAKKARTEGTRRSSRLRASK